MNICIFKGWVQEKPELKLAQNGKRVTSFQIGVPRRYKGADGKRAYDYITVEAWEGRAEFCSRYLDKGSEVATECELRIDKYEKDGQKRYGYVFALNNIEFCSGRATQQTQPANAPSQGYAEPQYAPSVGFEEVGGNEDLPF